MNDQSAMQRTAAVIVEAALAIILNQNVADRTLLRRLEVRLSGRGRQYKGGPA